MFLFVPLFCLFSKQSAHAQFSRSDFPETGHVITGEFLDYYWQADNPLMLYGYPITNAYRDEETGLLYQYFQRARFELHPSEPPGYRVKVAHLGSFLYVPDDPLHIPENFPPCRKYPQTGYMVCYAFLDFFDAQGGVAQFGYPLSNFEVHNGSIVQYFQKARFEWDPKAPVGQRVKLGDIGSEYYYLIGEDPRRLEPDKDIQKVLRLKVRAYPLDAIASGSQTQDIYILVLSQYLEGVNEAEVEVVVLLPDGQEIKITPPYTNEHGITNASFQYTDQPLGLAKVMVTAKAFDLVARTVTSFRIWP